MKAVVKTIEPQKGQRVIVTSDIHGNLEVFQKLLKKVGFCKEDILILGGDLVEKGPRNLDTLQYIIELTKTYEVYTILGNCDTALLSLLKPEENERLKSYLKRRSSTIHEMYRKLGYEIDDSTDMAVLKHRLCEKYQEELMWIQERPHILVAGNYYFAHAGLKSEDLSDNSMQDVIREDEFLKKDHKFLHTVVVGHMPVVLYDEHILQCNPIFERGKNIISIDGGNVLKVDGQLNALIIEDVWSDQVTYESADLLPRAIIKETRRPKEPQSSINIRWSDGEVEVIKQEKEFSYCRHCSTGHELWILNEFLYQSKEATCADEGTDYLLPVEEGDEVSVVRETSRGYLVKKDGIVGWYEGTLRWI